MKTLAVGVVLLTVASAVMAGETCSSLREAERVAEERAWTCRRDMCGEDENGRKQPGTYDDRRCQEDCPPLHKAAREARQRRERAGCKP